MVLSGLFSGKWRTTWLDVIVPLKLNGNVINSSFLCISFLCTIWIWFRWPEIIEGIFCRFTLIEKRAVVVTVSVLRGVLRFDRITVSVIEEYDWASVVKLNFQRWVSALAVGFSGNGEGSEGLELGKRVEVHAVNKNVMSINRTYCFSIFNLIPRKKVFFESSI